MTKIANTIPAKQKILDAALNVIRGKGYSATTVDDLCAAAGVTKGAFFHHFKTKEELGVAAARHWSAVTSELFAQAPYHKLSDPLDRVLGYIDFRRTILQGEVAEYTCLVGTMVQETFDSNPAIREACGDTIFAHARIVENDIAEAKQMHAPDSPWSAESLSLHIQSVLQGSFILAKARYDSSVASESIAHLRRYIELLFQKKSSQTRKGKKA